MTWPLVEDDDRKAVLDALDGARLVSDHGRGEPGVRSGGELGAVASVSNTVSRCSNGTAALSLALARARRRAGGRGDRARAQLHRHWARPGAPDGRSRVRRHRSGHLQHRPGRRRASDHGPDRGDHPRAPARRSRRHGPDHRDRGTARHPGGRGRRAGSRRDAPRAAGRRYRRRGRVQPPGQQEHPDLRRRRPAGDPRRRAGPGRAQEAGSSAR